jgi:hypothetical protein
LQAGSYEHRRGRYDGGPSAQDPGGGGRSVVVPVQFVVKAAVGPGDPHQRENRGELAEPGLVQVTSQMAGGLGHEYHYRQVVEELNRADHALIRLLAVRAGRLPQRPAQPGPALASGGNAFARLRSTIQD